ncbi:hypothetical protein N9L92_04795 [Saprospiraceae bacterium]|nr:hypothetical protein [Saprospiraceae bacterium]
MRELIYTVLFISLAIGLDAQKNDKTIIVMKSGSIIEGEIINWEDKDHLILKCKGIVDPIVIEQKKIKNIFTQDNMDKNLLRNKSKGLRTFSRSIKNNFKERGLYTTLKGQFITANDGDRANGVNGYGVSVSAGHRFCRLLAVGGGLGYDQFIWDSGEEMIPIFAEVSGFFNNSPTSVFYNLQTGYSFALSDEEFFIESTKGGFSIYPSIGLRFGQGETKMTLDFGYKIQNATYTYSDIWTNTTTREQNLTYKRMTLRLGVLLQ